MKKCCKNLRMYWNFGLTEGGWYMKDLPENYEVIHKLRIFIDEVNRMRGGTERIVIVEAYANLSTTFAYYGSETYPVAHPFNFGFARAGEYYTSMSLHSEITTWLEGIPEHAVPTWNAENHDRSRVGSRFVREYSILINIVIMLLPGAPGIYYGQEICMVDGLVRYDQERDTVNLPGTTRTRDLTRTPMQWDSTLNAGFSSSLKPWLPVNPNYWYLNVESEQDNAYSCLNIFKELCRLRKTKTCKHGKFQGYKLSTWIYAFTRTLEEYNTYVVVLNLGTEYEIINLHGQIPNLRVFLKVLIASENSGYKKG
ncbi:hypothetical protein V9T40_008075 [Parthenolecanium corni]|uniref:Glycosyl hydrolase family 13 catalytic domain-containing protein n=1 Tax=Parthenolecanium corni TaxID=536013 RepID=A0AAN9TQS2_9HEMI